jgi:hypothetical protein
VLESLAVQRVQNGVAGAVGGRASALHRGSVAEIHHMAAERPLVDFALFGARERNAVVLELVDGGRRLAHHVFDGIDVAQPVRALDGVVHMPLPIVRAHIGERGGNPALRCHGM